jgi:hypothetical protein
MYTLSAKYLGFIRRLIFMKLTKDKAKKILTMVLTVVEEWNKFKYRIIKYVGIAVIDICF